jgi:ABC-type Na+ efflux pump permease subunit
MLAVQDPRASNGFLRVIVPLLGVTVLLMVVMTAASKVCHERERTTLESLLTSPLTTHEILWGKLLGALALAWPMRWGALVLGVLAILSGGLNVFALPFVAADGAILGVFFGVLGLWCSQASRRTVQALAKALAVFLVLMVGAPLDGYAAFAWSLLTPWRSLSELIVPYEAFRDKTEVYSVAGAVCSPLLYAPLAEHLWMDLCRRFDAEANRLSVSSQPGP